MEIEATRSTVESLEKRIDAMGQDIGTIGANVNHIIKILASLTKMSEKSPTDQTMTSLIEPSENIMQSNVHEAHTEGTENNNRNVYNEYQDASPGYKMRSQSHPLLKTANTIKIISSSESIDAHYISFGDSGISLKHLAQSGNINETIPRTLPTTMEISDSELLRTSIQAPTRLQIVEDGVVLETTDL